MTLDAKRSSLFAAIVLGCVFAFGGATRGQDKADPASEDKQLAGLWRLDSLEMSGMRMSSKDETSKESELWNARFRFTSTKAEWVNGFEKQSLFAPLKLNPQASPKTVDLDMLGFTIKGIYSIDDGVIKTCFSVKTVGRSFVPGTEPRPTDFTTKGSLERLVLVFVKDQGKKD